MKKKTLYYCSNMKNIVSLRGNIVGYVSKEKVGERKSFIK